jgi:diacylglycerol kinase family enzyme
MVPAADFSVIINERSGPSPSADAGSQIQAAFARFGARIRLERVHAAGDIAARARQAATRGDVLVAAGGDGTVGTVAGVAAESGSVFGALPMGTRNHFARDLGLPLDLQGAVSTVVAGHVRNIDVAEVNGRFFINNSSLGIYPRMVWERDAEELRGRGRAAAFAIAMMRTWRTYRTLVARLSIDGHVQTVRTPFIFIGNNQYTVQGFRLGARAALDEGRLSVFAAPECGRFEILTLPLRALTNRLVADAGFQTFNGETVDVEVPRARVTVALDGELAIMRPPLHYRIRAHLLRAIAPEGRSAA